MSQQWYYAQGNVRKGPVSPQHLKELATSGQLQSSDLVWREGMSEWASAGSIKGLFDTKPVISPPPPPPTPRSSQGTTQVTATPAAPPVHPARSADAPATGVAPAGSATRINAKMVMLISAGALGLCCFMCMGLAIMLPALQVVREKGRAGTPPANATSSSKGSTTGQDPAQTPAVGSSIAAEPVSASIPNASGFLAQVCYSAPDPTQPGRLIRGKWGFVDQSGKIVIAPHFDEAKDFSDGVALGKVNGKWQFVDPTGQKPFNETFDDASSFSEGRACVRRGARWEIIDRTGKSIAPIEGLGEQHSVEPFSDGMAIVSRKSDGTPQTGAIDLTGKVVIEPMSGLLSDFNDGRSLCIDGEGNTRVVDRTGANVRPADASCEVLGGLQGGHYVISEGLIFYRDRPTQLCGFLDTQGRVAIPASTVQADTTSFGYFSEGLAAVCGGINVSRLTSSSEFPESYLKWGYIDKSGRHVVAPQFDYGEAFSEGLAAVRPEKDGKWGYIDRTGRMVIAPQFDKAGEFVNGLGPVGRESVMLIDKTGKTVVRFRPEYDVGHFHPIGPSAEIPPTSRETP